jgi:hypothetical protein
MGFVLKKPPPFGWINFEALRYIDNKENIRYYVLTILFGGII